MEHYREKISFNGDYELDKNFPTIIGEENSKETKSKIISYVKWYYTGRGYQVDLDGYQKNIDSCIKASNIEALQILWCGIYYHDRDFPDFEKDLKTAVKHSNLKTVQHIFWAYHNYPGIDFIPYIDTLELYKYSLENSKDEEVKKYIKRLSEVIKNTSSLFRYELDEIEEVKKIYDSINNITV